MKIQLGRFGNQILGALHILFAGELHLDLVGAQGLHNRLFRLEFVDTQRDLAQHDLLDGAFDIRIGKVVLAIFRQYILGQVVDIKTNDHVNTALQIQPQVNDFFTVKFHPPPYVYEKLFPITGTAFRKIVILLLPFGKARLARLFRQ